MTLNELLKLVKRDHEIWMMKAHEEMLAGDCFCNYVFRYRGHEYHIRFNLLTLDFIAKSKMPVSLRSKIKSRIIKEEYLKWKFKKEGRAFFDFLGLYYDDYSHIRFTDCESPDFIIHDRFEHGYEVTEATDMHNAKFNEAVYLLTGMDHNTKEFKTYISHIERSLKNKHTRQKTNYNDFDIHKRILECIEKKALKYHEYDVTLKTRNVIIFNNRIAFRRQDDFEIIRKGIQNSEIIKTSHLDNIYIISGTHDVMVSFNKYGDIIIVKRNKTMK